MKRIFIFLIVMMMIGCFLTGWKEQTESEAYVSPGQEMADFETLLEQDDWGENEFRILFYQTGLGRSAIEAIPEDERKEKLLYARKVFFEGPQIECTKNSLITWQEENTNTFLPEIATLEKGDILVSFCTHTFGWRNGHTAIVIDSERGKTLEAVLVGYDSCVQNVTKWRKYPAFIILRLRGATKEERSEIAEYALQNMEGVPYGFFTDIFEHFGRKNAWVGDTDCSHLIWKSYQAFGYNLDSDGGMIVTPRDIAESPLLEVVQVYGIDLESIREEE